MLTFIPQKSRRGRKFLYANFEEWYEPVTESGCWLWLGPVLQSGHGRFAPNRDEVKILVHRWIYEQRVGYIPEGQCVCHRCDVPCCVNPSHLFLGTIGDNNRDRAKKGRSAIGERAGKAKLTADAVIEIRSTPYDRRVVLELAARFGVSPHTIRDLRSKKTGNWKHLQ